MKSGIIAVVGRANVGKSTFINRVLDEKVSIVSDVAQTTRNLVRGFLTEERGQLAFLDTPGVHRARHDLGKLMNRTARSSVKGVDVALLLLDGSTRLREEDEGWINKLMTVEAECVICFNKIDRGNTFEKQYRDCWDRVAAEKESCRQPAWMRMSAKTGEGVDDLLAKLYELAPEGPYLFPEDILTDFPRNWTIADALREKLFAVLREELPHAIAVRTVSIEEKEDKWHVKADILVNKASQKGIVIGNNGSVLRKVKREAAAELSEMYGKKIELDLWVKVEKKWAKNPRILKQLGYI